jgi:hypothetical protein
MALMSCCLAPASYFEAIHWSPFTWAMAEWVDRFSLAPPRPNDLCTSLEGVAFGPRAELRWSRQPQGTFRMVLIDDSDRPLPAPIATQPVTPAVGESDRFLLWSPADQRIPRELPYASLACAPGAWPAIKLAHYEVERTAPEWTAEGVKPIRRTIVISRFVELFCSEREQCG